MIPQNMKLWDVKVVPQGKLLAANTEDLSLIPHGEEENG